MVRILNADYLGIGLPNLIQADVESGARALITTRGEECGTIASDSQNPRTSKAGNAGRSNIFKTTTSNLDIHLFSSSFEPHHTRYPGIMASPSLLTRAVDLSDNRQPQLYASSTTPYLIALACVILRFWCRWDKRAGFWLDDWLILFALVGLGPYTLYGYISLTFCQGVCYWTSGQHAVV